MGSSTFVGPRCGPILVAAALIGLPLSRDARADAVTPVPASTSTPTSVYVAPFVSPLGASSAPPRDSTEPADGADPWEDVRRPWLYAPDPTAPPPGHVVAALGMGFAQIDRGAARPFAADVARA